MRDVLFCVFFISGVWHGANFTFFIWGVMHGILIVINKIFLLFKEKYLPCFKGCSLLGTLMSRILTLIVVVIGWVFFRSASVSSAISILKAMFFLTPHPTVQFFPSSGWWLIAILSMIVFFLPNTLEFMGLNQTDKDEKSKKTKGISLKWQPSAMYSILLSFLLLFCICNINKESEFLYFQF